MNIETIPTAYILLDGGNKSSVSIASNTLPLSMHNKEDILSHALAGMFMGNKIIYFGIFIVAFSCTINDHSRSYKLAKTNKQKTTDKEQENRSKSTELIWEKPDSWVSSEGSSMRLASFSVPYSGGSGDLSVIKLAGTGGGLESNVNRWRRQLNLEPISLVEIEKNIIRKEGFLGPYSIKQIINEKMDSAFLCAIIPTGSYTIFVKLSLRPMGIIEVKDDFIAFCSSLNIPN